MTNPANFYAAILGVARPWQVIDVVVRSDLQEVHVDLALEAQAATRCPTCGKSVARYDSRKRRWRHLDMCQYKTLMSAEVPRVQCPEHGVLQVRVPWAEPGGRCTELFESMVIDWLKEASILSVARQIGMSWDVVAGIQDRAVQRGLERRELKPIRGLGVDETAFRRRYDYVTVVSDLEGSVLHVADDRKKESLDGFFSSLSPEQKQSIEVVAMDMWEPYIQSVAENLPLGETKICFDKFHVAKHLGDAVNQVRVREHRELTERGDDTLKRTKYLWLTNPENMEPKTWERFSALRDRALKVARAWAIKETAMELWNYSYRGAAAKAWEAWITWASRCRLEPVLKVASMVRRHLAGILNAVVRGVTNARPEGLNAKIQWIKRISWGFRNKDRFRNAIYFHLGGLDLYPATCSTTHTKVC
jgi:transposase